MKAKKIYPKKTKIEAPVKGKSAYNGRRSTAPKPGEEFKSEKDRKPSGEKRQGRFGEKETDPTKTPYYSRRRSRVVEPEDAFNRSQKKARMERESENRKVKSENVKSPLGGVRDKEKGIRDNVKSTVAELKHKDEKRKVEALGDLGTRGKVKSEERKVKSENIKSPSGDLGARRESENRKGKSENFKSSTGELGARKTDRRNHNFKSPSKPGIDERKGGRAEVRQGAMKDFGEERAERQKRGKAEEMRKERRVEKAAAELKSEKRIVKNENVRSPVAELTHKEEKRKVEALGDLGARRESENRKGKREKPVRDVEINEPAYFGKREAESDMRLNKYIAHCGIASRRAADTLIMQGHVTVNGAVVQEMGYKVQSKDIVAFKGKVVKAVDKMVYYLLNKPTNVLTTSSDERGRRTVIDIMNEKIPERIYPVGRLDRNTSGLLLLTNDGELTKKLSHPSHKVPKVYQVLLDKNLSLKDMEKIREGITLEDGDIKADSLHYTEGLSKREVQIEVHSGKNRLIRRIFEHLSYEVVKLDRTYYAGLTKKNLPRGVFRPLTKEEVRMLKHFT